MMLFPKSVSTCFKKYAVFSGRASRSEYWWFALFQTILLLSICILSFPVLVSDLTELNFLGTIVLILLIIVCLALFLPSLAVSVRRCHDVGHSGWYILVPIYGYIVPFLPSEPCENKWGKTQQQIAQPNKPQDVMTPKVQYRLNINGQSEGPYNMQQLQQMVQNGKINSQNLVWKPGMSKWERAGKVAELATLFENVAPSFPDPVTTSNTQYTINTNGQNEGPYNIQQLQQLIQGGKITRQTYVWKQGMNNWEPAGKVSEVAILFGAIPPPPPPMPTIPPTI